MSRRQKSGLFQPPPPESGLVADPHRARWRPRREAVGPDGDEIVPHRLTHAERLTDANVISPLHLVSPPGEEREEQAQEEEEDGLCVALPDVPPLRRGEPDDLRLPNPDRWAPSGAGGLPVWFWGVMAAAAVGVGLWIVWGRTPPVVALPSDLPGAEGIE